MNPAPRWRFSQAAEGLNEFCRAGLWSAAAIRARAWRAADALDRQMKTEDIA